MPDLETLARLIHAVRHPAGYGHSCGRCREEARRQLGDDDA